jgi:protein NrfC
MGNDEKGPSRRAFLVGAGAVVAYGAAGTAVGIQVFPKEVEKIVELPFKPPAKSEGYLVVDTKKCSSCLSCMVACSLVQEGKENISLSRIQILPNTFERYPNDIQIQQCRQCVHPPCVLACPTSALHADADNGNVRTVDETKCIGCKLCLYACPYVPRMPVWDPTNKSINDIGVIIKCDLCAEAPYWPEEGGPDGKQACVENCPLKAIKMVNKVPDQEDTKGYIVNLRTAAGAAALGLEVT